MVTGRSSSSLPANTAAPIATSTSVAMTPPWTVPPAFRWRSSTINVAVALSPSDRETSTPSSSPRLTDPLYPGATGITTNSSRRRLEARRHAGLASRTDIRRYRTSAQLVGACLSGRLGVSRWGGGAVGLVWWERLQNCRRSTATSGKVSGGPKMPTSASQRTFDKQRTPCANEVPIHVAAVAGHDVVEMLRIAQCQGGEVEQGHPATPRTNRGCR